MTNYLGVRKFYSLLKDLGYDIPKLKDMEYRFYRGSEFLDTVLEEISVEAFLQSSNVLTVSRRETVIDSLGNEKKKEVSFCSYRKSDEGKWIKVYETYRGKVVFVKESILRVSDERRNEG